MIEAEADGGSKVSCFNKLKQYMIRLYTYINNNIIYYNTIHNKIHYNIL